MSGIELLGVVDVEATCVDPRRPDFQQEIIEFPCVVLDVRTRAVVATFHRYIRPTINPVLSDFCTSLTGIAQATVDAASPLREVLGELIEWLREKGYTEPRFAFATDGPWDLNHFLHVECEAKSIALPPLFDRWVNLRWLFSTFYQTGRLNVQKMLTHLGITFEGREHSGLCDAQNIAKIAVRMIEDGCAPVLNDGVAEEHSVNWQAPGSRAGDWRCPACNDLVFGWRTHCRCGTQRPFVRPRPANAITPLEGDWTCPACGDLVFARRDRCRRCGAARPTNTTHMR